MFQCLFTIGTKIAGKFVGTLRDSQFDLKQFIRREVWSIHDAGEM